MRLIMVSALAVLFLAAGTGTVSADRGGGPWPTVIDVSVDVTPR